MSVSSRIRERAAEVVHRTFRHGVTEKALLDAILALPDDPEEGAIRAAAMEEAADSFPCYVDDGDGSPCAGEISCRQCKRASRIRALAPAPSGWMCVMVSDLKMMLDPDAPSDEWLASCDRLRAALKEQS